MGGKSYSCSFCARGFLTSQGRRDHEQYCATRQYERMTSPTGRGFEPWPPGTGKTLQSVRPPNMQNIPIRTLEGAAIREAALSHLTKRKVDD